MGTRRIIAITLCFCLALCLRAQVADTEAGAEVIETYVPTVKVSNTLLDNGDTIRFVEMSTMYIYPERDFSNPKERKQYDRTVRNVKKTLPIAKEVRGILIETVEYLNTLPDKKARDAHMKLVEKEIMRTYKPKMKKLTLSQGKMLIKLVDRECASSGYELVHAFLGPIRAGFYQAFAALFGASLKKNWDPDGEDHDTEMIVRQVEAGQI